MLKWQAMVRVHRNLNVDILPLFLCELWCVCIKKTTLLYILLSNRKVIETTKLFNLSDFSILKNV